MYASSNLSGIPEDVNHYEVPWSQQLVNDRWALIGRDPPAPLLPASMVGMYAVSSRGPRMLSKFPAPKHPKGKDIRGVTKQEGDFLNYWGSVAVDPFRKQSTVSKVAGGIIKVASVAVPVASYFQAATSLVNAGADIQGQKSAANLESRVMQPAIDSALAQNQSAADAAKAASDAAFNAKLQTLSSVIPGVPQVSAPKSAPASAGKPAFGWLLSAGVLAALAMVAT